MRVSLFIPCITDQFYPEVGIATAQLLQKFGAQVIYPGDQTCCGQPAFNSGYHDDARKLAERFVRIFSDAEYIVAPSGSCVSMVKVFYEHLALTSGVQNELHELKSRIFEISEFLVKILNIEETGASFPHAVTYHDACHLLRELGISEAPRKLIRSVKNIQFYEMPESARCCGFGGTFSVKFPEISVVMGEDKIKSIQQSGAEYVIADDSSCLMHIDGLLRRQNIPLKTMHIAQLLTQGL
jgi:L-lactate dehydrogenase complex protein LldE